MATLTCGSGDFAESDMFETDPFYKDQRRDKFSFVLTFVIEAVRCEVVSTHTQTYTNCSRHIIVKK